MADENLEKAYRVGELTGAYLQGGDSWGIKEVLWSLRAHITTTALTQVAELTLEGLIGVSSPKNGELPDQHDIVKGIARSIIFRDRDVYSGSVIPPVDRVNADLLNQYMRGLVDAGLNKKNIRGLVRSSILDARAESAKSSSYTAVDAVNYLDDLLDELNMNNNISVVVVRALHQLRNRRKFGADINQSRRNAAAYVSSQR